MTKVSAKQRRRDVNRARKELRLNKKRKGKKAKKKRTYSNCISKYKTVMEELASKEELAYEQIKIYRRLLPGILYNLSQIEDIRNPKQIKHKLNAIMFYGLMLYVYHIPSRRGATEILTSPQLLENLMEIFPEIESMPHGDTVKNVLAVIDVEEIQEQLIVLVRKLIRSKTFRKFLVNGRYLLAIDGLQAYSREIQWSDECYVQEVETKKGTKCIYSLKIVESYFVFPNGIRIPLLSEVLENTKGDISQKKQDCETNAAKRLIKRLKKAFLRLPITLLADSLYATGPFIQLLVEYKWDFMITFKGDSIPTVWKEALSLIKYDKKNSCENIDNDRHQVFKWANDIDYTFGANELNQLILNVVICEESWEEIDAKNGNLENNTKTFAWLSGRPIHHENVITRCNIMGRNRWSIEEGILIEKKHGFSLEHQFSEDWSAMKGFYYLMRIAYIIDELFQHSVVIQEIIERTSMWKVYEKLFGYLANRSINKETTKILVKKKRIHLEIA